MDEVMFETINEVIVYVKEKGKEILGINPLSGCGCPNCGCYDNVVLYADEPQYHESFSTSWWSWFEIVECDCGTIYQFFNGS